QVIVEGPVVTIVNARQIEIFTDGVFNDYRTGGDGVVEVAWVSQKDLQRVFSGRWYGKLRGLSCKTIVDAIAFTRKKSKVLVCGIRIHRTSILVVILSSTTHLKLGIVG